VSKADNLPPSCAVVTKSGNLNFLEPSGSFRACNGTVCLYIKTSSHGVMSSKKVRTALNCVLLKTVIGPLQLG